MKSEPYKEEKNNNSQAVNEEIKNSSQEHRVVRVTLLLSVITAALGLIFFFIQLFFNDDDYILDSSLDLPVGKDVILTNRDFNDCRDEDASTRDLCISLEAGVNFEPGLYTLVITPIDDVKLSDSALWIEPSISNIGWRNRSPSFSDFYMSFFGVKVPMEIENVPLDSGSEIEISATGGIRTYSDFMEQDNVTIEFIAQSEYKPFVYKSGSIGYYRVGKSIAPGEYKITRKTIWNTDPKINGVGYRVSNIRKELEIDEYYKIYLKNARFELVENEVFIIDDPEISLKRNMF